MSLAPSSKSGYLSSQSAARGLGPSTSTSLIAGDRRKIHTSFTEKGAEMVEEYDVSTDALLLRKLRYKSSLGAWGPWTFEIGEPVTKFNADRDIILEASNNPLFVRQDTPTHFEFRVRNLPYEYDNYIVEIDEPTQEIVLKTKNKKYYKRMNIPDLKAGPGGLPIKLDFKFLNYKHANNTLVISYVKPPFILDLEKQNRVEIKKLGNGATATTGVPTQKALPPPTAAQALLQEAQSNAAGNSSSSSSASGGPGEFSGLKGLKGLGNKDADCKQQ